MSGSLATIPLPVEVKKVRSVSGKDYELEAFYGRGHLLIASIMPEDNPVACITKDIGTGIEFSWEDPYYSSIGLIKAIVNSIGKPGPVIDYSTLFEGSLRTFKLLSYDADYLFGIDKSNGSVVAFLGLRDDGEAVCFWISPRLRGSHTMSRFQMTSFYICLKEGYVGSNLDTIVTTTGVTNVASNKLQADEGFKFLEKVTIDGNEFNRYSTPKDELLTGIELYLNSLV